MGAKDSMQLFSMGQLVITLLPWHLFIYTQNIYKYLKMDIKELYFVMEMTLVASNWIFQSH